MFFLERPSARAIFRPAPNHRVHSAWEQLKNDHQLRRLHRISHDEMKMLSRAAGRGSLAMRFRIVGLSPDPPPLQWPKAVPTIGGAVVSISAVIIHLGFTRARLLNLDEGGVHKVQPSAEDYH